MTVVRTAVPTICILASTCLIATLSENLDQANAEITERREIVNSKILINFTALWCLTTKDRAIAVARAFLSNRDIGFTEDALNNAYSWSALFNLNWL